MPRPPQQAVDNEGLLAEWGLSVAVLNERVRLLSLCRVRVPTPSWAQAFDLCGLQCQFFKTM